MKNLILLIICVFVNQIYGQELDKVIFEESSEQIQELDSLNEVIHSFPEAYKLRRVSIGMKLGIPIIAGVSLEGITTLFWK